MFAESSFGREFTQNNLQGFTFALAAQSPRSDQGSGKRFCHRLVSCTPVSSRAIEGGICIII